MIKFLSIVHRGFIAIHKECIAVWTRGHFTIVVGHRHSRLKVKMNFWRHWLILDQIILSFENMLKLFSWVTLVFHNLLRIDFSMDWLQIFGTKLFRVFWAFEMTDFGLLVCTFLPNQPLFQIFLKSMKRSEGRHGDFCIEALNMALRVLIYTAIVKGIRIQSYLLWRRMCLSLIVSHRLLRIQAVRTKQRAVRKVLFSVWRIDVRAKWRYSHFSNSPYAICCHIQRPVKSYHNFCRAQLIMWNCRFLVKNESFLLCS
jgi:hypothetical protein